ncbi:alpha/beta hydrolase [Elizabethkingia anophelis]|uniref:alpha/beta hydrolase n=2 Tax=Elizabethkingia anophelis TaxID=1117645 RepID=UPI0021A4F362|nr:alpha/beta hydrolase [Elizabethkingia anophelis]
MEERKEVVMDKVYIFSGLGVDERVFDQINFEGLDVEFIDWIKPLKKESLSEYAKRISSELTADNPTLIGLSFGGILAVEISKILRCRKIVLIASAKSKYEVPKIYRIIGKLKINRLIPGMLLKQYNLILAWFFGITSDAEKKLLKNILKDTDSEFLSWAINEIVNWKNKIYPKNYIHIHGNKDHILPLRNVKADFVIKNGGHFMTVNQPKEIEKIIRKICTED